MDLEQLPEEELTIVPVTKTVGRKQTGSQTSTLSTHASDTQVIKNEANEKTLALLTYLVDKLQDIVNIN